MILNFIMYNSFILGTNTDFKTTCLRKFCIIAHADGSFANIHAFCDQDNSLLLPSEHMVLKISAGSGSQKLPVEDFEELAKEYASREVQEDGVEVYPPDYILPDDFSNDVTLISEYLQKCLARKGKAECVSSIIKAYNPDYHRGLFVDRKSCTETIDANHLLVISSFNHLILSLQICEKINLKKTLHKGTKSANNFNI